jgi:hypothetical protein
LTIPFVLSCYGCDAGDAITSLEQGILSGWTGMIEEEGLSWNQLGWCPDCRAQEEHDEAERIIRQRKYRNDRRRELRNSKRCNNA